MRGHEPIVKMRMCGLRPTTVWVTDNGADLDWHKFGSSPEVEIQKAERLDMLDLRWAAGLQVNISTMGKERAKQTFNAFLAVSPKRVISTACELLETNGKLWPEAVASWDTEGVLQWLK